MCNILSASGSRSVVRLLFAGSLLVAASADCKTADPAVRAGEALKVELHRLDPEKTIDVRIEPGPLGTRVVTAVARGAYPGTGVFRVILDHEGHSYGAHGERNLADLAHRKGWLASPPESHALVALVNDAQFEGLLSVDESEPARVQKEGGGLVLRFVRRAIPSGLREQVTVRFPEAGKVEVMTVGTAEAAQDKTGTDDPVARMEEALSRRDPFALTRAIAALRGRGDARAQSLLARATLVGNDKVAADAMLALGDGEGAAKALVEAWKGVAPPLRQKLVGIATDLFGAGFGARVK